MGVVIKNNSGGWETSPFMRRLRGFGAYLPFRVPIAAAPFPLWNELLINNVEPVASILRPLETTLNSLPDETRLAVLAGAGALSFALAKAPARECFAALAWVTRPLRRILAWKGDGKGGHAGFASLFSEFDTRYRKGMIFLGSSLYDPGLYLGEHGESGLLTFGAARSGKQRGGTIPVCGTWPYSLFCIDAKAQHSNVSYWRRLRFGPAFVSAPFGRLQEGIPTCRWNPLEWLDPQSDTYFEDVLALADAMIIPTDIRNFFFDDSARQIIAGAISHVRTYAPENTIPNLLMVRKLLTLPDKEFEKTLKEMLANNRDGGLARDAASRIMRSMGSNELNAVLATVSYNTHWITSKAMRGALSASDFSLATLQEQPASLFLVLPVAELSQHGRYLRMFVYSAIRQFSRKRAKVPILMILDEAYSLGTQSFLTKTISNIPSFNVRIWPIYQDGSQPIELYPANHQTWSANATATSWLSANEPVTQEALAARLGRWSDGHSYYNLRELVELGKLTNPDTRITVVTRSGRSPLLVRRVNYDIGFPKRWFAPDPDFRLKGWAKTKHTLQRLGHRLNRWI